MPIIAVVGNKGGADKTTLSVNLAAGLAKTKSSVLVDADPQGSASHWRAVANHDAIAVYPTSAQLDDNSALEGKSIFDMGRRGADAAVELDQLIEEVITV